MPEKPSSAIKRDRLFINAFPIFIAIIVFAVISASCEDIDIPNVNTGHSICFTMISVWATCLGFLITAVSILLALNNGSYIEMLKKTGHYKTVLICFMSCCFHTLVALILTICITFFGLWSVFAFALLCASTIDVLIIIGICLYFLLQIVIRNNT